jgi:hypothetical protein
VSGPVKVGLAGLAIGVALAVRLLAPAGWDVSVVGAFGEDAEQTIYAEQALGREVVTRSELGHDGRFFFVQANDPWLLSPDEHAVWLDRPIYRSQRMLFPVIASAGGAASPEAVLWGMLVVNVLAMGVGGYATAALAIANRASPWWGLAFPLNPGMVDEFGIGGAGVVAFGLGVLGIVLFVGGREIVAGLAFAGAILARETMLLILAGTVLWAIHRRRGVPVVTSLLPVGVWLLWAWLVRLRLPGSGLDEASESIGLPFVGMFEASQRWELYDWAVMILWALVSTVLAFRVSRRPSPLGLGAMGFVVLALVMTAPIWWSAQDVTRATAPVFTAWIFASFVEARPRNAHAQAPGP